MMKRLAFALALVPALAFGQSSPNWPSGYRPSMQEWNALFASKQDNGGPSSGLPLTGGTVTGLTTFSGAGTGLAVTNNETVGGALSVTGAGTFNGTGTGLTVVHDAAIGGNLTVGGTFNAAAFNVTSGQGFQVNGQNALFITAGIPYQQGVFVGPRAGLAIQRSGTTINFGMVAVGPGAAESLVNGTAEMVAVGYAACQYATTSFGTTCIGEHAIGFDNSDDVWAGGNDAMRNTIGNFGSSGTGSGTQQDGTGHQNTSNGFLSLRGNAGSIAITGTPSTGDVLHVAFSTTNANTTGLPHTINYTVQPGETLLTIATNLAAAISSGLTVGYILPDGNNILFEAALNNYATAFTATSFGGGPPVIAMHFPGGTATGWAISMVATCTGACTEVLTVSPAFSGTDNIAEGREALYAINLTSGSFNHAKGTRSLANLAGSSSRIQCDGYECGFNALAGANSVVTGALAAHAATALIGDAIYGDGAARGLTTGIEETVVGAQSASINCITTGNGNVEIGFESCVLSPTASWQLDVQMGAIRGANNNFASGGSGGGQIGIEIASAAVMNATFTISDYGGAAAYGSHFRVHQTTAPALSACGGGSPAVDATASDTAGTITEGTTATGCTITFTTAYATTPHCTVSNWAGNAQAVTLSACSTTALTVTNASGTGNKFTYQVIQ